MKKESKELKFIPQGAFVFWRSPEHSWIPAEVISQRDTQVTLVPLYSNGQRDLDAEVQDIFELVTQRCIPGSYSKHCRCTDASGFQTA